MKVRHLARGAPARRERITAILGPTNTGKTHFAIERMLAHRSGMIGLPLRLLAREVYEKVVRIKGAAAAALVTGEEKIVPPEAKYFVCTVEAMPLDLGMAFLAIDEIQLCADPERGHVFTNRLLHARGDEETMFLGAETMRSAIGRFVPDAVFVTRPRFSDLAHAGHRKLTRLPRRSAIVAFSAEDVYGIADLVRRQRGGAAVVLGALSPRTRNAQVALYQSGEVDFLVATDAIGMGLNMAVDHVAFAAIDKFDGLMMRPLKPDELGQIAGRAGRHMNDGTFGTTADVDGLDEDIVQRIETHRYEPHRVLQWRNAALDFRTLPALIASLEQPPPLRGLAKARLSTDLACLESLAADPEIGRIAGGPAGVKTLWSACQLPDFRKLASEDHARLVGRIFRHLMSPEGVLPEEWLARQVARLDDAEGDVSTLSGRLAQIRTWTYAAHRPGWVRDPAHWQNETRAVEDRLSDALHERLTQRFVDRRTAALLRTLRDDDVPMLAIDESGGVTVGGEMLGKLEGFRFVADQGSEGLQGKALRAVAAKGLESEFLARAQRFAHAEAGALTLSEHGRIWWEGAIIARLARGASPLEPGVVLVCDERVRSDTRRMLTDRLRTWLTATIAARLAPLIALRKAADAKPGTPDALQAAARGIAHQLCEHFGSLRQDQPRSPAWDRATEQALTRFGVRFARRSIYMHDLLRPDAAGMLVLLWSVWSEQEHIPGRPPPATTSFEPDAAASPGFLAAAGFRPLGPRAIRLDILDRLEARLERAVRDGTFADQIDEALLSLLGCGMAAMVPVLAELGWRRVAVGEEASLRHVWRARPPKRERKTAKAERASERPDSPFAGLASRIAAD
ncbi:MAG TPA: helicase-related protein [Rhizomicrobium sp.]|jgi:ATP-dependent RNA helicase SUPV3L1/SUV3